MTGDRIYATNESGQTTVFQATPEKFEVIATNQLGVGSYATQTLVGGRIYARVLTGTGDDHRERLYCLGN